MSWWTSVRNFVENTVTNPGQAGATVNHALGIGKGGGIAGFVTHPFSSVGHVFTNPGAVLFHGKGSAWHGIAANPVLDVLVVADVLSYGALSGELGAYAAGTAAAATTVLPYAEAAAIGTYSGGAVHGFNSLGAEAKAGPNTTEYRVGAEFAVAYGAGQLLGAASGSSIYDVGASISKGLAGIGIAEKLAGQNFFAGPGAYTPGASSATQGAQQILADLSGQGYSNQAQINAAIAAQQAGAQAPGSGSGAGGGFSLSAPGGGSSIVTVAVIAAVVIAVIAGAK